MTDGKDPPIEEQDFLHGLTVVDIGDYRVSRGMTRRPFSVCPHRSLTYDSQERRIWCRDCEQDVDPFDAFIGLAESYSRVFQTLKDRANQLDEAEKFQARSLAVKALDKVWRSRTMVPACPHCSNGLFPEDFKNGAVTVLGREYAEARLGRSKEPMP